MLASFNFEHQNSSARSTRVGLRYGKTGVPVFLITYPGAKLTLELFEYENQINSKLKDRTDFTEVFAWKSVQTFFLCGGERAWVITTPWVNDRRKSLDLILAQSLLGEKLGFRNNTGIYKLDEVTELADLVSIPQAGLISRSAPWVRLYERVAERLKDTSSVCFVDFPKDLPFEKIKFLMRGIASDRLIAMAPWVFYAQESVPSSVVATAVTQWADGHINLADSPANVPLSKVQNQGAPKILPVCVTLPTQMKSLNDAGLNVIQRRQSGEVVILGSKTTSKEGIRDIAVQRRTFALKSLLEEICDEYVFNQQSPSIYENLEMAIENEMQKQIRIFNDAVKTPFRVSCYPKKIKEENQVQVDFDAYLVGSSQRINLDLNWVV